MNRSDIPNLITILRILLVPPIVYLLYLGDYDIALLLFLGAGLSDALDGFLAKHYGWMSRLGGLLDPIADKALLMSSYVVLAWVGLIPRWLVVVVVLRDVIIFAGALTYHLWIETLNAEPSVISKLNTVGQILLVVAVIFSQGVTTLPPAWLDTLVYVVLATTVLSGIDYVWTWGWRAWNKKHGSGRFP